MGEFRVRVSKPLVNDIVAGLQDQFGDFGGTKLSDAEAGVVEHWVPSGYIGIDKVLTAGVPSNPIVPMGRIVTCEGLNQSGKTTTMIQVATQAQLMGILPVFIDNEEKLDKVMAENMHLDPDFAIYTSADSVEETFEKAHHVIDMMMDDYPDKMAIVFWDSLGGTTTEAEMVSGGGYATAARTVGEEVRKIIIKLKRTHTCFWVNNHIYANIGVTFGDKWKPYGGEKVQFHATWRLRFTRMGLIKEGGVVIGSKIKIKTLKNNTALPFQEFDGHLLHGLGWSNEYTTFDLAKRKKIKGVKGGGTAKCSWVTPEGEELVWKGWKQFRKKIVPHEEFEFLIAQAKDAIPLVSEAKPKKDKKK